MAFYGTFTDGRLSAVYRNGQSIGCCCVEPYCCMYSATALASGDMGASDLPDAITLLGVGSLSRSGTGYGDTTDGVIFETDVWAIYRAGVRTTRNCLIQGDGKFTPDDDLVEDQFHATYTITRPNGVHICSRESLCEWYNADTFYSIWYGISLMDFYGIPDAEFKFTIFESDAVWIKDGLQNSPIGTYSPIFPATGTATVA